MALLAWGSLLTVVQGITRFLLPIGGASGWAMLGSIPAIIVVAIHLGLNRDQLWREVLLIVAITLLGVIVETGFVSLGALHYSRTRADTVLPPIWIIALWFGFGTLPHGSLGWLSGRIWLQLFLDGVLGPSSYFGGVRLGAATMPGPMVDSLVIIGIGWELAMVSMFQVADRLSEFDY